MNLLREGVLRHPLFYFLEQSNGDDYYQHTGLKNLYFRKKRGSIHITCKMC